MSAKPDNRNLGHPDDELGGWEHECEQVPNLEGDVAKVSVGVLVFLALGILAHERANHADTGELLAQSRVHPVDPRLLGPKQRVHPNHDDRNN